MAVFSGIHDKHEDWRFKKTLLTTEDRWFGQPPKAVACLNREVKEYDIDDLVQNSPPEVTTKLAEWMNAQVYNVLTLWTARMWLTKKMSAAWVKLLRSYKGKHAITEASNVHNVSSVASDGELENWRIGRLR